MHVMVSKWAPPSERSVLTSIIYAGKKIQKHIRILFLLYVTLHFFKLYFFIGTALGTVIALLLSGLLADHFGWVWIFYVEGSLCLIWCTAWWLMVEDSPEKQKRFITLEEKELIASSLNQSLHKSSHVNILFKIIINNLSSIAIRVSTFIAILLR